MIENIPIDTSHPAVREYLALIRLQVLTPLSLLINIATLAICTFLLDPNLGKIAELYPTSITPQPHMIGLYIVALFILQVGYCALLVLSRTQETKRALVKGCGFPLMLSNWVFALWAISWVLQAFILSTICLGVLLVLLVYANVVLLIYHAPTMRKPFDLAFIHAPTRAFMLLPLTILFPYSLFITLGKSWSPGEPQHYSRAQWPGFAVMLAVNLLGLAIITIRRDVVWCVAATWICASVWSLKPKPAPVLVTVIAFTVLHPAALVASYIWSWFQRSEERRTGPIALPPDEEGNPSRRLGSARGERPAREVDAEAIWG